MNNAISLGYFLTRQGLKFKANGFFLAGYKVGGVAKNTKSSDVSGTMSSWIRKSVITISGTTYTTLALTKDCYSHTLK